MLSVNRYLIKSDDQNDSIKKTNFIYHKFLSRKKNYKLHHKQITGQKELNKFIIEIFENSNVQMDEFTEFKQMQFI